MALEAATGDKPRRKVPVGKIGRLTGEEWGRVMDKHVDHHLRRFGA